MTATVRFWPNRGTAAGVPERSQRSTARPRSAVDSFGTRLLRCGAMPPAPTLTALECLRCRAVYDDQRLFTGCPRCARESVNVNLSVELDPAALGPLTPASFPAAPRSLWRFRQLLPLARRRRRSRSARARRRSSTSSASAAGSACRGSTPRTRARTRRGRTRTGSARSPSPTPSRRARASSPSRRRATTAPRRRPTPRARACPASSSPSPPCPTR